MTEDTLSDLLIAADPGASAVSTDWAGLAHDVVRAERTRAAAHRRTVRRRRVAAAGLAALITVPTAAWAADRFFAQTGERGSPGMSENDTSEWVDPCAADFGAYARSLPPPAGLLPPPSSDWARVVDRAVASEQRSLAGDCAGRGARMQETGVRSLIVFRAQQDWMCEAVRADDAGDADAARRASRQVTAGWDALERLGVLADDTWRPWRAEAARGDLTHVREVTGERECAR